MPRDKPRGNFFKLPFAFSDFSIPLPSVLKTGSTGKNKILK
jgi:hypothetical protein